MHHMPSMTSGKLPALNHIRLLNVSELTARINDDGWESCFTAWLKGCNLIPKTAFLYFLSAAETRKRTSVLIWSKLWNMQKQFTRKY